MSEPALSPGQPRLVGTSGPDMPYIQSEVPAGAPRNTWHGGYSGEEIPPESIGFHTSELAPEKEKAVKSYTWFANGFDGLVYCYLVDLWVRMHRTDSLVLKDGIEMRFEHALDRFTSVPADSRIEVFSWNSKLYSVHYVNKMVTISGSHDIEPIRQQIDEHIKKYNPYKGAFVEVRQSDLLRVKIKPRVSLSFDDVILPDTLKNDIYDNTVFNMRLSEGNNGVILHGVPGTGKSHICKAISGELAKDGVTSIVLSNAVDFSALQAFIEFVGPSVVFLEDADTYAFTRDGSNGNGILADFLQFVNGIADNKQRLLFIATTNYIDKLDAAIANRPMRFNRKFAFTYPSDAEIDQLVALYFGPDFDPSPCYKKQFTGSHIQELHRTATMLSCKEGKSLHEVYPAAVKLVAQHFSPSLVETGFRPN